MLTSTEIPTEPLFVLGWLKYREDLSNVENWPPLEVERVERVDALASGASLAAGQRNHLYARVS
jgi:hypothetical protein